MLGGISWFVFCFVIVVVIFFVVFVCEVGVNMWVWVGLWFILCEGIVSGVCLFL